MSDTDIIEFIFFPVVNEGCRVIAEVRCAPARYIDVVYRCRFLIIPQAYTPNPTAPTSAPRSDANAINAQ